MPALNELAEKTYAGSETYADRVHIVHIYVIEPHPKSPDVSPYTGTVWEGEYSSKHQPLTYAERLAAARDTKLLLEGNQLILIDDLVPGDDNNPVWCTYGPCPNCAYLIRQDGIVDTVETWLDVAAMQSKIDALLQQAP